MDPLTLLVFALVTILIGGYLLVNRAYSYWKSRGIYYIEPSFPYGNCKALATNKEFFGDTFTKFYKHFKSKGVKGGGIYAFFRPVFVPVDLDLVKSILQKDFGHFVNHGRPFNTKVDPLSGHLFNLENEEWRKMRIKLTPTFTSAKMKMMFQTFVACTEGLVDILKDNSIIQDPVDIKEVVSRFTTDIIGSCAFGIDCNSIKNPNSDFRFFGKQIFQPNLSLKQRIKITLLSVLPRPVITYLNIKRMDRNVEDFFMGVVKNTVNYREKNQIRRNDFMQLLLQLKNDGKIEGDENGTDIGKNNQLNETLSMNELAAQCFVFFIAGFETSATTMTFALLELSLNQDIQDKLRSEIESVLNNHNGNVCYEAVMQMSYLDKVIQETLRRHSAAGGIVRTCNTDFRVPGTDFVIESGRQVHVPVHGIHNDPEYYPQPEKFDPERFSEDKKASRPSFTFLAFGDGPRNCIGARFGLLQAKVGLLTIIQNFRVTLNKKTKIPITYEPGAFITSVDGGVWLNVQSIKKNI